MYRCKSTTNVQMDVRCVFLHVCAPKLLERLRWNLQSCCLHRNEKLRKKLVLTGLGDSVKVVAIFSYDSLLTVLRCAHATIAYAKHKCVTNTGAKGGKADNKSRTAVFFFENTHAFGCMLMCKHYFFLNKHNNHHLFEWDYNAGRIHHHFDEQT